MENIEYIKRIEFVEYEILGFIYKSSVSHENTYINVINHFEEGFRVDAQSVFYDLVRL